LDLTIRLAAILSLPLVASNSAVYLAELTARKSRPAPIGVVGVGRMGRGVVDQIATMVGIRAMAAADLDGDRAMRAFTENGWERGDVRVTERPDEGIDALRAGRAVVTQDPLLLPQLELEAVVEATGDPETGAEVAASSIEHRHHTVMLNVEADVVVGPLLAERARRAGVVYTLAAGDQPGAILEMAEWARTLGFQVVCAGRGTVLFADDHHATPEKYLDMAARNRMNPKMYTEFRDGTKPQLEMVAVSNVLRACPTSGGYVARNSMRGAACRSKTACPRRAEPAQRPAPGSSPGRFVAGAAPRPDRLCRRQPRSPPLLRRRGDLSPTVEPALGGQLGPPGILLPSSCRT